MSVWLFEQSAAAARGEAGELIASKYDFSNRSLAEPQSPTHETILCGYV